MNNVREKMLEKLIDMFSDMPDRDDGTESSPEDVMMDKKMGITEDSPEDVKMDDEELKPHAKIEMISMGKPGAMDDEKEEDEDPFQALKNRNRAGW